MKTVSNIVEYVHGEMQDPKPIAFNRTKAQLFLTVTVLLLAAQIGLYVFTYGT